MDIKNLKIAVMLGKKSFETEASGGVTLKNIKKKFKKTNVDRISVGGLTHSINAIDIKLEYLVF